MRKLLSVAALGEAVTGVSLLLNPALVTQLLFSTKVDGTGAVMSRIAGIALVGLGFACFPGRNASDSTQRAFLGMFTYSFVVTIFFGYIAIGGGKFGILFYPAIAVHAVITTLFVRAWFRNSGRQ